MFFNFGHTHPGLDKSSHVPGTMTLPIKQEVVLNIHLAKVFVAPSGGVIYLSGLR